jgi:peptidyl-prolyl cis-trans isomerase B (cyclophilin B)
MHLAARGSAPGHGSAAIHTRRIARAAVGIALAVCVLAAGCGVESRKDRQARAEAESAEAKTEWTHEEGFEWPHSDGPRPVAVLHVKDMGTIRIALYPELAPKSVESFEKLVADGFYDGTTFHRVIPDFMIQGGDPNSRDDDPRNDGQGGAAFRLPDEFSNAHHTRGTVSLANTGRPNSSGSQFFIVQKNQPFLDGKYNVIGRVVDGMEVVDRVTAVDIDTVGRWGTPNRPMKDVVIDHITLEEMDDTALHAAR